MTILEVLSHLCRSDVERCGLSARAEFGGRVLSTPGIGSLIAEATAAGDYPLFLAATLAMIVTVVLLNRLMGIS